MGNSGRVWIAFVVVAFVLLAAAPIVHTLLNRPGPTIKLASASIPLDGRAVSLPLEETGPGEVRVVVSGSIQCGYDGTTYVPNPPNGTEAGSIGWAPSTALQLLVDESSPTRAVLRLDPAVSRRPESVEAWVEVDRFVHRFIITPAEVRDSLSGDLTLEVYGAGRGTALGWSLIPAGLLCMLLGAVSWLRRDPGADMRDIEAILRRIDEKYPRVRDGVADERWDAGELKSQLKRLHSGAHELARHIGAFRETARRVDREQLASEIAGIEKQLEGADREELRREIEATLDEKQKVRGLLADTDANEARYVLRLSKIDSALDAVSLQLAEQDSRLADDRVDRKAMDALGAELKSLDEAIGELSILDDVPT